MDYRSKSDARSFNVVIRNGGKCYPSTSGRKQAIFSQVNMSVPPGSVYGLLGPSGCGKTTLLRCILGRLNLDQGSVVVFGLKPGTSGSGVPGPRVGYMPQDTCIPDTLTIGECWSYYGAIAGLTDEKIASSIRYFIRLLNLPPANTVNSSLSGGQLRRVAFATALIHEPQLLILDEPTVGIDCITKKNMLEHLLNLANEKGTSIILTTHYIEEAKSAHNVGLMQGGTLALEGSTEVLLRQSGCATLEEIFLKLYEDPSSLTGDRITKKSATVAEVVVEDKDSKRLSWALTRNCIRAFALKAVIRKNFIQMYRFPGILLMAALLPCVQVSMSILSHGSTFGPLKMAQVNDDLGPLGRQYLDCLGEDVVNLEIYGSTSRALIALQTEDVHGLINIPQNFSKAYIERIQALPMMKSGGRAGIISIVVDNTYFEISRFLHVHLLTSFAKFLNTTYSSLGLNPSIAQPVIMLDEEATEFLSIPNSDNACIGVIVMATFYLASGIAIFNLFVEWNRGYLERSIVAGLKSGEIVIGLLVTLMAISGVQVAIILLISKFMLFHGLTFAGSCWLYAVLYCHGLCGITFGMLVSLCFSQTYLLLGFMSAAMLFSGASTGGTFPLAAAPMAYRYIIMALPMVFPVNAISAIHRNALFIPAAVTHSLACSLSWTAVFLAVSITILKVNH